MIGFRALGAIGVLCALVVAGSAQAADCPGNPNAIGTSRTIYVDPTEHVRLGVMQYPETLPLADHEVVLTFDDGPLPPHTTRVLKTLASECVKATFFLVGRMAKSFPESVRQIHAAGHTIGTHSQNHPLRFNRMTTEQINQEVEGGISSVAAALGDRNEISPFFRVPGLLRSPTVERYLADKTLMTWSADFPADDWLRISNKDITARALRRIEARGRGMLLLHDIKPTTAAALPTILQELKKRGYRIVHVAPASAEHPKTVTRTADWAAHLKPKVAWSKPPQTIRLIHTKPVLLVPDRRHFELTAGMLQSLASPPSKTTDEASTRDKMAASPPWPPVATLPAMLADARPPTLAVPGRTTFGIGKGTVPIVLTVKAGKRHPVRPLAPDRQAMTNKPQHRAVVHHATQRRAQHKTTPHRPVARTGARQVHVAGKPQAAAAHD